MHELNLKSVLKIFASHTLSTLGTLCVKKQKLKDDLCSHKISILYLNTEGGAVFTNA